MPPFNAIRELEQLCERSDMTTNQRAALSAGIDALSRRCATCGYYDAHGGGRGFCTNTFSYFSGQAMPAEEGCIRWRRG